MHSEWRALRGCMMDHSPPSGAVVFLLHWSLFIISIMTLLSGDPLNIYIYTRAAFWTMIQFFVPLKMGHMPAVRLLFWRSINRHPHDLVIFPLCKCYLKKEGEYLNKCEFKPFTYLAFLFLIKSTPKSQNCTTSV